MVQIVDDQRDSMSLSKDVGAKSTLNKLGSICTEWGITDWFKKEFSGKREPTRRSFWPQNPDIVYKEVETARDPATTEIVKARLELTNQQSNEWEIYEQFTTIVVSGMMEDKNVQALVKLPAVDSDKIQVQEKAWRTWDSLKPPKVPFFISQLFRLCKDSEEFLKTISSQTTAEAQDEWIKASKSLQSQVMRLASHFAEMLPGIPSRKLAGNFDS
eukprot:TRINITY_DN3685_c0_g1_i1.p1 TRINITY_DN3685_c0_g1~~TRINITY_DN3685_c0_g1_i1.p1  ORF type:complete len:215 (-),score=46.38 TRINITY_DN3685_c0_g1_i1:1030-1674(-)